MLGIVHPSKLLSTSLLNVAQYIYFRTPIHSHHIHKSVSLLFVVPGLFIVIKVDRFFNTRPALD